MFFMTKAAQFGRGTYTAIGDVREVQAKMTALFRKLESPALTDIASRGRRARTCGRASCPTCTRASRSS